MNCKKARELILTDYIDNEMDGREKTLLEKHLSHCMGCKEFAAMANKVSADIFAPANRVEPPEFIWRRVKESIVAGQRKKANFAAAILEKIKYAFYIPNPALAFATILALILVFGAVTKVAVNNYSISKTNISEQAEYLEYSLDVTPDASAGTEAGFGTSVEKYFL